MSLMGEHLAICLLATDGRVLYRDAHIERALGVSVEVGERLGEAAPWLSELSAEQPATFSSDSGIEAVVTPTGVPGAAAIVRIHRAATPGAVERDLRVAQHTLTSILDAAPISILVLDMDKRVTLWNAAATRMFGWTPDEVVGSVYPLVPEGESDFFEKLFDRVVSGEGFTGVEARRSRKDGTGIDLRIHTAPMRDPDGLVVGAMAILEDLSEQRRLEEQVAHNQKVEAVGRLAGGIAHDFNNLLTVILGTSEMLMARNVLSLRVSRGLQEINDCGERARTLTAQLLAFSRRQVLHPELVDMSAQVRTTSSLISRLIGGLVHLKLELSSKPLLVQVDTGQFDQVLVNLAVNARDAMKDGGGLTIRTWADEDGEADHAIEAGRHAVLEVRDTGSGISEEVLPRIFDPFFTTKRLGSGTGLGLATVHGIVEQSGGTISARNLSEGGVAFVVRLPLRSGSPAQKLAKIVARGSRPPGGKEAVLLVEDDAGVRNVTTAMLKRLGYEVTAAHDGRDALVHLKKGLEVALVITDLAMPRMGGKALCAELGVSHPNLPVLFVSANIDDEGLKAEIDAGRARFLQKPFTLAGLALEVRSALDE